MKAVLVVDVEEYGDYYADVYRKDADDRFEGRYYLKPLPKWKIDGCSAFNEDGGIVYDDEVFDWVKELIE